VQDDSDYYKWAMKLKKSFGERMAPLMETSKSAAWPAFRASAAVGCVGATAAES
jgi:hypothetical protein